MESIDLVFIGITLLFSAFFSGMEIAFVSSNKLKIELDSKQGKIPAKIYSKFLDNQSNFIGAMLVGNNIALVIYGILMAKVLEPFLIQFIDSKISILLLQTLISTLLVLISAEFLPKTIFRINPNSALNIFSIPTLLLYILLYPLVFVTIGISNLFLKLVFNSEIKEDKPVFGIVDLDHYLKQGTAREEDPQNIENEVQIFQNALDFSHVKVRECMIPRTEIIAMDLNTDIKELKEKFIETGLSKILIYKENIDNIIGYTHSFEMFKNPEAIKNVLLPVSIVPETMAASEALNIFIKTKRSIAVVVDEFGGTSGMITLEDIVEQIFGEIEDEHDHEELIEVQLEKDKYHLSARHKIDDLNDKFKLNLPESEQYETLAGFIINHHQHIPKQGEKIKIDVFNFEILKVSDNRIDEVVLELSNKD